MPLAAELGAFMCSAWNLSSLAAVLQGKWCCFILPLHSLERRGKKQSPQGTCWQNAGSASNPSPSRICVLVAVLPGRAHVGHQHRCLWNSPFYSTLDLKPASLSPGPRSNRVLGVGGTEGDGGTSGPVACPPLSSPLAPQRAEKSPLAGAAGPCHHQGMAKLDGWETIPWAVTCGAQISPAVALSALD